MANNEQEITPGHPNKDKNEYSFDILTDETVSKGSLQINSLMNISTVFLYKGLETFKIFMKSLVQWTHLINICMRLN